MKPLVIIGTILMVVGMIALAAPGFTHKTKKNVLDAGPLTVNVMGETRSLIPPTSV